LSSVRELDIPLTNSVLEGGRRLYGETGLFWGSLILLTSSFVASKKPWLFMKFGYSGTGKTVSDKVAVESFGQVYNPLCISGRITPAGMAKLLRKSYISDREFDFLEEFRSSRLLFIEDLSRTTTNYLKLTTLQFLAGLTRNTSLDDLTSEGGTLGEELGEGPKKVLLSGTPSDWDEISSTSIFEEFIDRRSLTAIALMSHEEWKERESTALTLTRQREEEEVVGIWKDIISQADVSPFFGPLKRRTVPVKVRNSLYEDLKTFKRYPENLLFMLDSLAEGHARINGRCEVKPIDYYVLKEIFRRFLILGDMRKKELFLLEEVVRSDTGYVSIKDLAYRIRMRSPSIKLPSMKVCTEVIRSYTSTSKYLTSMGRDKIVPSDYLKGIFTSWKAGVRKICQGLRKGNLYSGNQ